MNVILEISVVDILKSLVNNNKDTTFLKSIDLAKQKQKEKREDFITLFAESFSEIDPNGQLAALFTTVELKGRINYNSTNEEVLEVIKKETNDAIDNAFNIITNIFIR